jgi:hypothetical protein
MVKNSGALMMAAATTAVAHKIEVTMLIALICCFTLGSSARDFVTNFLTLSRKAYRTDLQLSRRNARARHANHYSQDRSIRITRRLYYAT